MFDAATRPPQMHARHPIQSTWDWLSLASPRTENEGMPVTTPDFDAELHVETTTIMFADVVESVRLMQQDELTAVKRVRELLRQIATDIVPLHSGIVLERRGDGLLIKFADGKSAAACALDIHRVADAASQRVEDSAIIALRVGLHTGDVLADTVAIYGQGINLASRVTAIAGPGETVLSATTHDLLVDSLDGDIEDLGECYFKHVDSHVRIFRLHRAQGETQTRLTKLKESELRPTIAILPFHTDILGRDQHVLGEVIADGLIAEISRCPDLRVISRLSSSLLRDRAISAARTGQLFGAKYLLNGRCNIVGSQLVMHVELEHSISSALVWTERIVVDKDDILQPASEAIARVSSAVVAQIGTHVQNESAHRPLPNLDSSALLFGAIGLTHRTSLHDFNRPRLLLEQLVERHSRAAAPRAWLAHWYVLRSVQGRTEDAQRDAAIAIGETNRALDAHPQNSLALATQGWVYCHLLKDLDRAEINYRAALSFNPSDAFAWIYLGALHAFRGEGADAEAACAQAVLCSPMDPRQHFFEAISATAAFTNERYDVAISKAHKALQGDRYHASSLRVLAMSLAMDGRVDEGRSVAAELLRIEPSLTIERYLSRTPSAAYEVGRRCATALRAVGIPER